jgi:hypothetical protein
LSLVPCSLACCRWRVLRGWTTQASSTTSLSRGSQNWCRTAVKVYTHARRSCHTAVLAVVLAVAIVHPLLRTAYSLPGMLFAFGCCVLRAAPPKYAHARNVHHACINVHAHINLQ